MAPKSSVAMSRSTSGGVANQDRPVRGEEGVQRTGGKSQIFGSMQTRFFVAENVTLTFRGFKKI